MGKIQSLIDIAELIAHEFGGRLTPEEKLQLDAWLDKDENNRQVYLRIKEGVNDKGKISLYHSIDKDLAWTRITAVIQRQRRKRLVNIMLRYAAVLVFFIFAGSVAFWLLDSPETTRMERSALIEPGSKTAVLVLASGKNVNLAGAETKNLIEDDGSRIRNENEILDYSAAKGHITDKIPFNKLIVPRGGEYSIVLSDGTRVYVNSMSELTFPVRFTGNRREITLQGEAYFEVSRNESCPFVVSINGVQVEVLGTTFNIRAYPDEEQSFTTLVQGKVSIKRTGSSDDGLILDPDEQVVFHSVTGDISVAKTDARMVIQWVKGKYLFHDEPLDHIMLMLSRWYDFSYHFEDETVKDIRFEGGLNRYESFDPIIDIISRTGKVKVKVEGKEVRFSRI